MLKQLIQLFAEKFLTNKKSWLYQNSIALKNDPITVFSGSSEISEQNYTAPSNGMALVSFRKASAEDISCFVEVNGIRRQQLHNLKQGWEADTTVYLSKGDLLRVATGGSKPEISKLMFFPTP